MLPPLPRFFCGCSVVSHGSFLEKIGGEGRGEGAVLARGLLRKPLFRPIGPPSRPEGEKELRSRGKH